MSLQKKLQEHREEKLRTEKEAGTRFLTENKGKEGVVELPSGIQYRIVQPGSGPQPTPRSRVKAHYAGRLISGKEFDNSFKRGQPFVAPLTSLIRGWQEVLPLMPVGSRWILWIPSDLAYGDGGVGQAGIPGGAVLEFEIELLEVIN